MEKVNEICAQYYIVYYGSLSNVDDTLMNTYYCRMSCFVFLLWQNVKLGGWAYIPHWRSVPLLISPTMGIVLITTPT